jgi:hypothetical protein
MSRKTKIQNALTITYFCYWGCLCSPVSTGLKLCLHNNNSFSAQLLDLHRFPQFSPSKETNETLPEFLIEQTLILQGNFFYHLL